MKSNLAILLASAALVAGSTHADDREARIQKGIKLHDRGDYDAAVEVYRAVLVDYPHDPTAVYEMAFSCMSRGTKAEELVSFLASELTSGVEQHAGLPMILGWGYDRLGRYEQGEAAMRRALERLPHEPMAHYNLAVNLKLQERWSEAAESFVDALRLDADRTSAWFGLAVCMDKLGRPARALFAGARAALIEPDSERGRAMAGSLWSLLFTGISMDGSNVSITLPSSPEGADSAGGDDSPPDPESMERIALSITAANRALEKWAAKSDAEFFAFALESITTMLSELDRDAADPFWALVLPWFEAARKDKHIETMAYVLRLYAGDVDASEWVTGHKKRLRALGDWMFRGSESK